MVCSFEQYEKLRAIGVGTTIRHAQQPPLRVLDCQAPRLIVKFAPIHGLAASAITQLEVATLTHEAWNNAMELGTLIMQWPLRRQTSSSFACAQAPEILDSLRTGIVVELEDHATYVDATDLNLHKHIDV